MDEARYVVLFSRFIGDKVVNQDLGLPLGSTLTDSLRQAYADMTVLDADGGRVAGEPGVRRPVQ